MQIFAKDNLLSNISVQLASSVYFIGQFFEGSTANHRLYSINQVGFKTFQRNQNLISNPLLRLVDRVLMKLTGWTFSSFYLNRFIKMDTTNDIDFIWVDKGLGVLPSTLKVLKEKYARLKIIHYSPDDMLNPDNQTRNYLKCIPLYDLHVTTKSYNVHELYSLGAKNVLFVNNAYAPEIHTPYMLTSIEKAKYGADVSFIGAPERERAESINWLVRNGIKVTVWGNGWSKWLIRNSNLVINEGWFANEEYCKIISASKINIAFLRKINRDLQTTRTMEIPACGGFMLAERTNEHLELFKEDVEAVYFSDDSELQEKIEYYLTNAEKRISIATNGLRRCRESGYDNITMVRNVFMYLEKC